LTLKIAEIRLCRRNLKREELPEEEGSMVSMLLRVIGAEEPEEIISVNGK